jgi:glutathione synthase/RimK-type ligase-like ATP-grasp enzyme
MEQYVLVLTNSNDGLNSSVVIEHIERLGHRVIRLDVDRLTSGDHELLISYGSRDDQHTAQLKVDDVDHDLLGVRSVWFRRPYHFDFRINDPIQRGAADREVRGILYGLWQLLAAKHWVSKPTSISRGQLKSYQLKVASQLGLRIPDSVITNSPERAREFCLTGPVVFKPIAEYSLEYGGDIRTAFTTRLTHHHISQLDMVRKQPVLLQRWIAKKFEIRLTCVGRKFFAAKLSCEGYEDVVDWRLPEVFPNLRYEPIDLPRYVADRVRSLMAFLDLEFGAIDFAVDNKGDYYFLEINPVGQWLWIEEETHLPISAAIAQRLIEGGDANA